MSSDHDSRSEEPDEPILDAILDVEGIEAVYDDIIIALRGVSLRVSQGGVVALLGANGAGKTTTLKAISGLLSAEGGRVTAGTVRFGGVSAVDRPPRELARAGLVQVLEGRHCFPHFTVEENLIAGALARGTRGRELRADLDRIYDFFPRLRRLRGSVAGYTSGGEQQMVAIGRALMGHPRLLLLDEPSMGLAPQVTDEIFRIVRTLNREQGVSVLLAEQNARQALRHADHGYVLENGRVVASGTAAELAARADVREFYLGVAGGRRRQRPSSKEGRGTTMEATATATATRESNPTRTRPRSSLVRALWTLALVPALSWAAPAGAVPAAHAADEVVAAPAGESTPPPVEVAQAPAPSAPRPPDPAPAAPTLRAGTGSGLPEWLRALSIGGGAILWYFQPVDTGATRNVDLFFANLLLDGKFGVVGLHIEPRFRDSRLRAFFPGPVWAQEVYASVTLAPGIVVKAGKAYSHFGLFWDNSFYGNVQVYDGLKLDPDYGLSLEGSLRGDAPSGLRYYAQYFLVDGQTNVSLAGRDTISVPSPNGGYSRRRNQTILRVEPFWKPDVATTITAGASGEFLQAALPGPAGTRNVLRAAGDLSVAYRHAAAWGEYIYQNGQTVTEFPVAGVPATDTTPAVPGRASAHNHYLLAGAQYRYQTVTLRYNVSNGRYRDLAVSEWMHVPAVALAVGDNLTVLGEYVDWRRHTPAGTSLVDRSLNVTLQGHF